MAAAKPLSIACLLLMIAGIDRQNQPRPVSKTYKVAEIGYSGSISDDGRVLVYGDSGVETPEDHVFVLDRRTGEKRQLTRSGTGEEIGDVRVSRDGQQVAYEWLRADGTRDLRVVALQGGAARIIYQTWKSYRWMDLADWSPDGKQIAVWLRRKDGASQLGLVTVGQGSLRVLKSFPTQQGSPARFSPDGRFLAYTAQLHPKQEQRDIAVISIEDASEFTLVGDASDDFLLDWMPDGKRLLFASNRSGSTPLWIIEVANQTSIRPYLVPVQLPGVERPLGLTADGSLYYRRSAWTNNLHVVAYEPGRGKTGKPEKLAEDLSFDSAAHWSPDGEQLAYFRGAGYPRASFALTLRETNDGTERQLDVSRLGRFGGHAVQPHWSPDSRSMLVQGRDHDFAGPGKDSQGLYRIDVAAGMVGPILQTRDVCPADCVEWPVWSRDERVIFMRWLPPGGGSKEPFKASIVALDMESGEEKLIYQAKPIGRVSHLAASPDGEYLAFVEEESDITSPERHFRRRSTIAIKTLPLKGGASNELVRLPTPVLSPYGQPVFELAWTPDSNYLIYAPSTVGHRPKFELWRVPRTGGKPQQLGVAIDGLLPYGLSVHPDGQRIAFTAGTPMRYEVWVLKDFLPALKTAK